MLTALLLTITMANDIDSVGFMCPRGRYFNNSRLEYLEAARVLAAWQATLRRRGYTAAAVHKRTHIREGMHTFESDAWLRPPRCAGKEVMQPHNKAEAAVEMGDEVCTGTGGSALVSDDHRFIYRIVAKAGSNSLVNYFKCNFGMKEIPCKAIASWKFKTYLHVASTRDPVKRFISGYRQIRFQHNIFFPADVVNCASPQADQFWKQRPKGRRLKLDDYPEAWFGESGGRCRTEKTFLEEQTEFYGIDPDENPAGSFAAFIRDHQCPLLYFSSEHVASAVGQSSGRVCDAEFEPDFLFRLHHLEEDMATFKQMVGFDELAAEKCPLKRLNDGTSDHKTGTLGGAFFENLLLNSDKMIQDLCVVLFQDLLCFNYKFPFACSKLIKEALHEAGIKPRSFGLFADRKAKAVESDLM
jgi:hypothetical protein